MSKHVFKIENGAFGLTLTDPDVTDACSGNDRRLRCLHLPDH